MAGETGDARTRTDPDVVVEQAVAAVEHTTAGHHVNLVTHGDHGHPETYLYDALAERFDGVAYEYVEQCGCGGHVTRVYREIDRGKLDLGEHRWCCLGSDTACELACEHCRADAQPRRHPDELSTAEGKALLDQASEFGDGQLVVLSGGDPLARGDLPELVEYGTEQGLRMTLTPSGTNSITPERLAELDDAGLRRLALSIDGGDSDAHDTFRGESGSFEATMAAAEAARNLGIPLQINTTVCAETVEQLPAIRDLVADLDAVLWSVFFLVPVGRGRVLTRLTPSEPSACWSGSTR